MVHSPPRIDRGWRVGGRLVVPLAVLSVLPLTWMSLRMFNVPERHELAAGAFMTAAYALIVSAFAMVLSP